MTIDEAIAHCLEMAEKNDGEAEVYDFLAKNHNNPYEKLTASRFYTDCAECAADHRQLAKWLMDYKELEAKHWDECRQRAHYDNDVKLACNIIRDRIAYVTNYGKGILEGKYSDSFEYNNGYCTALKDMLDLIYEATGGIYETDDDK